jgi:hypothetical protein
MSTLWSVRSPRTCSGAMSFSVPSIMLLAVTSEATMRASPKSRIFTIPSSVMKMFAGLMSRWITRRRWANDRPSQISAAISSLRGRLIASGLPSRTRLAEEALAQLGIVVDRGGNHLERNDAFELLSWAR